MGSSGMGAEQHSGLIAPHAPDGEYSHHGGNQENFQEELPHPWLHCQDDYGNIYYFNPESGESSWHPPVMQEHPSNDFVPLREGDWIQQADQEGNLFWYNDTTGEAQWDHPQSSKTVISASAGGYTIE